MISVAGAAGKSCPGPGQKAMYSAGAGVTVELQPARDLDGSEYVTLYTVLPEESKASLTMRSDIFD